MRKLMAAAAAVAAAALVAAGVGSAARTQDTITCGGTTYALTVTSTKNDNSVAWGVGTISGGTHLIPSAFTFTAFDVTTQTELFSDTQAKGNGNGQHNQTTMECSGEPETITGAEFGDFPGVSPDDEIQISFTVTAVPKP